MTGRWRHTDTGEATWIPAFAGKTERGRHTDAGEATSSLFGAIAASLYGAMTASLFGAIAASLYGGMAASLQGRNDVAHLSGGGQLVHNPCKKLPDDSCRGFIYLYLYGLPEEEDTTVGKSLGLIHASDDEEDVARGAAHGRGVGVGGTRQHRGSQEDTSGMG